MPTRRQFLLAAPAACVLPTLRAAPPTPLALGVAAYSFRVALDLKKPAMTLFDFIDRAAGWPVSAVELTSYFFADTTDDYLDRLKARCAAKRLAVSGVPVRSDFAHADAGRRRAEVEQVNAWVDRAARLGAATVRVFAGNLVKGADVAAARTRAVDGLQACGAHAAKRGVKLGVENHAGGLTDTAADLLALVAAVGSPAVGVNLDTGNFRTADPYRDLELAAPKAVSVQVKTDVTPANKPTAAADYPRVVTLLRKAGYAGVVTLEYEGKADPATAVPAELALLKKACSE